MSTITSTGTLFATSADSTPIAYEVTGSGPALIIVDGALCYRRFGGSKGFADALADRFTVYRYDRRGRGESGPGNTSCTVAREVEDLEAVIAAAGGTAHVFGMSSGAALALEAARAGASITRLAVFEAPFVVDDTKAPTAPDFPQQLQAMIDAGRPGDAVKAFMKLVGAPAPMIAIMRLTPVWKTMKVVGRTLPHDLSIVTKFEQGESLPAGYYDTVLTSTLVVAGGKSPTWMRNAQTAIADAVPGSRLETLPGQTHMLKPNAAREVLIQHFLG
jgi:pimeloyl-ACP methyl ester carboxylesterase